jgi:hypothetical protein
MDASSSDRKVSEWYIGGFIVGMQLPDEAYISDSVRLYRVTEDRLEGLRKHKRPKDLRARLRGSSGYMAAWSPPDISVYSDCVAIAKIEATNEAEAMRVGLAEIRRVTTALALATRTNRYYFELCRVWESGKKDQETPWSEPAWFILYEGASIDSNTLKRASELTRDIRDDPRLIKAIEYLQRAWSQLDIRSAAEVENAIVQNLFLIVEMISDYVAKEWRSENENAIEQAQSDIVKSLATDLANETDVGKRIQLVRTAANQLRLAQVEFQSDEIRVAGEELHVAQPQVEIAVQMNRVRNELISHPTKSRADGIVDALLLVDKGTGLCKAEEAAREFMLKYIEYRDAKST